MISVGTILKAADNSGARLIKCIRIYKRKKYAKIGDMILISVKTCNPKKKIKKGEMFKAIVIRTKGNYKFHNSWYKFSENAAILLNKKKLPIGTRLFGISLRSLRFINKKIFLLLEYII